MANKSPQQSTTSSRGGGVFLVGGGILTMALFPLAIPMVALLIVVALPLVALAAVVAAHRRGPAVPFVLIRGLSRKLGDDSRDRRDTRLIRGTRPVMGAR